MSIKHYLEIIKPGIILGNSILIIGSFLFASFRSSFHFFLFLYTVLGTSLVISSACILNNLFDADIDQKMNRTSHRVLSKKIISKSSALFFSIIVGFLGFFLLGFFVNYLSMIFAILGFFIYVFLYTVCFKRRTMYSTFIGSFSGSMPSLIGYTAVTNNFDLCSFLLFVIFIFWQMSHFYSISILRIKDYRKAKIPIFAVLKGIDVTKKHIFYYIIGFIFFSTLLTFFGYLSVIFLFLSSIIHFYWLFLSYSTIQNRNYEKNGRQLFYFSIIVVVFFNFLISVDFLF